MMSRHEIESPPFGTLFKEGRYGKIWHGSLTLPGFAAPFELIVRGDAEGPLPGQTEAMRRILSEADTLKHQATTPMVEMHADCDLLPASVGTSHDRIWALLHPNFIEVADQSYYGDGRIAILIAFQSLQEDGFVPAIETADGHFEEVLSGT